MPQTPDEAIDRIELTLYDENDREIKSVDLNDFAYYRNRVGIGEEHNISKQVKEKMAEIGAENDELSVIVTGHIRRDGDDR